MCPPAVVFEEDSESRFHIRYLTSLLKGSMRAAIAGYLLTSPTYMSTSSSGDFRVPAITSYFPFGYNIKGETSTTKTHESRIQLILPTSDDTLNQD